MQKFTGDVIKKLFASDHDDDNDNNNGTAPPPPLGEGLEPGVTERHGNHGNEISAAPPVGESTNAAAPPVAAEDLDDDWQVVPPEVADMVIMPKERATQQLKKIADAKLQLVRDTLEKYKYDLQTTSDVRAFVGS